MLIIFQIKIAIDRLTNATDPTVDPCQDFFRYTCGKWIKTHGMPEMDSSLWQFDIPRAQAYGVITSNSDLKHFKEQ